MKNNIILTEKQLDRVMKHLVSERSPVMTDTEYANYNAKYANTPTASWERKSSGTMPMQIKMSGTESFDTGKSDVKKDSNAVKKAVADLQKISQSGGGKVTVNGLASRTNWGSFDKSSEQAYNKNLELAKTRRDNMVKYLKSLNLKGVTIGAGKYGVSDSDRKENQNITLDISGSQMVNVDPKGDIGDNTRTVAPLYPKNPPKGTDVIPTPTPGTTMKRVCVKIPANLVDKYKVKIREFRKENGLGDIPFGVYDVK
jgi:hypothetical protein